MLVDKRRSIISIGAILAAIVCSATAYASGLPPAPFHPPSVGTVIKWVDEKSGEPYSTVTVGNTEGYIIRYTSQRPGGVPHDRGVAGGICGFCYREIFDKGAFDSLFPLQAGKSTTYVREIDPNRRWDDTIRRWSDTISVIGEAQVHVPAGQFDTYVISYQSRGLLKSKWKANWKMWFAPSVGWPVKIQGSDNEGLALDVVVSEVQLRR